MFNFDSELYQSALFSSILNEAFGDIFGISNDDGLVLSAHGNSSEDKMKILLPNETAEYDSNNLESIFLIPSMHLHFFKIKKSKNKNLLYSDFYQNRIHAIFNSCFLKCKNIYNYTLDHLSKRENNGINLLKIDHVISNLTECAVLLESLSDVKDSKFELIFFDKQFSILINVLDRLSKLGGARSILQNNAIDFLFHIRLFQKYIFQSHEVSI